MSLGRVSFTAGNKTRYVLEYEDWLLDGETLVSGTVVLDPDFTATVTDITISGVTVNNSKDALIFFVEGGAVDEIFTLDVQVVNSRTEIKNDTIEFFVVDP
jgi:hypothetical protein